MLKTSAVISMKIFSHKGKNLRRNPTKSFGPWPENNKLEAMPQVEFMGFLLTRPPASASFRRNDTYSVRKPVRMHLKKWSLLPLLLLCLGSCTEQTKKTEQPEKKVHLVHGVDESAGGGSAYIITTPLATYYLEKEGGGLSSMIDREGVDWIGFHNEEGSGHKGEYRGFPNAIHRQDGSYFHAMNAKTDPSTSVIEMESGEHVRIAFTSDNEQWQGQWDFYPDRCDFTMRKISPGYHYWVQYEGVPGGEMDSTDFWYASADTVLHPIVEPFVGDLPAPEWMAFGDQHSSRVLYMLHHEEDEFPDNYVSRPDMTVLGFGRQNKDKYLSTVQTFSIGFVESTAYSVIDQAIRQVPESIK